MPISYIVTHGFGSFTDDTAESDDAGEDVLSWRPFVTDFNVFDLRETVTLIKVSPDGTETEYDDVYAMPQDGIAEMIADMGGIQSTPRNVTWHVKVSTLGDGAVSPARGDRIVSTSDQYGGTWIILKADLQTHGRRWKCETQRQESATHGI